MRSRPMSEEERRDHLAALVRERDMYLRVGRADKVAEVEEQLRIYSDDGKPPWKRSSKRTGKPSGG